MAGTMFLPSLNKLLRNNISDLLNGRKIGFIDVGAAGDLPSRWRPYKAVLEILAFEPDERSARKLPPHTKVFPVALYSENSNIEIHLCQDPRKSSLCPPNMPLLERYPLVERHEVVEHPSIQAVTMDSVLAEHAGPFHFLKIDVQGAELEVLKGGMNTISQNILGAEIEVQFIRLYEHGALFGEVSDFMNSIGFEFIDFVRISKWERDGYRDQGQCAFGDALFLKNPEVCAKDLQSLQPSARMEQILAYFAILMIYRRVDLAQVFLDLAGPMDNIEERNRMNNLLCAISKRLEMHNRLMKFANSIAIKFLPHSGFISKV